MKLKKTLIITLLLLCLLMIGAVSAAENVTDDKISNDVSDDVISQSNDDNVNDKLQSEDISIESNEVKKKINSKEKEDSISSSKDNLLSTKDDGTFTALQNKIDNAEEGSTIILENDYAYNEGFSAEGIKIDESLTINDNGPTINENHENPIFHTIGSNVVVHNLEVTHLCNENNILTSSTDKITPKFEVSILIDCDDVFIDVALPNDVTRPALVDIDGVGYYMNITSGMGKLIIPDFTGGSHDVVARYLGDDKYGFTYISKTFSINDIPSEVRVNLNDITYGNNAIIEVSLPKDATGTVTITIDSKPYTANVSSDKTIFIVPDLKVGNYTVDVNYSGDKKYASSNNATYLKVYKSVTDDLEQKLEEEKAKVKILNEEIEKILLRESELNYQVQTLQKQLNTANEELKQYKLESHPSLKLTTKTIKKSKNNQLKAILKFSGKTIKGKTVTFIFNGKVYKTKTNAKGLAKINIKKSTLKKIKGKKAYYYAIYGDKNIKKAIKIQK